MLSFRCLLNEHLLMQVVMILTNIFLSLSQEYHNINTLIKLGTRQMGSEDFQTQSIVSKSPNMLVSPEIMRT